MRINYSFYGMPLTGGIRTIVTLANELSSMGHNISITTIQRRAKFTVYIDKRVKVIEAQFPEVLKLFDKQTLIKTDGMLKTDLEIIQNELRDLGLEVYLDLNKNLADSIPDCDISACTFSLSAFGISRSSAGASKVYHMQHFEPYFFDDPYYKNMALESYRLPLKRISNSSWLHEKLKNDLGITSDKVTWGIDTDIFNTKKRCNERLSRVFDSKGNILYIVSLARMAKWKGLGDLLDALKILKRTKPDLKIKLILFGGEFDSSEKAVKASPVETVYLKNLSDEELVYLYQNADIIVTSSWYESFPLPPLEAMACGGNVITTKYGVEDYAKNGVNSIIVEPQNPKAIANAIEKLATDKGLIQSIGKNGPKTAAKFRWETVAKRVLGLYTKYLEDI